MEHQDMLNQILSKIENIDGRLDKVVDQVGGIDKRLDNVAVEVLNIKEQQNYFVQKEDLGKARDEIMIGIDGLAKQNTNLDHELVAMRSKYERLEERLSLVEQKVGLST